MALQVIEMMNDIGVSQMVQESWKAEIERAIDWVRQAKALRTGQVVQTAVVSGNCDSRMAGGTAEALPGVGTTSEADIRGRGCVA